MARSLELTDAAKEIVATIVANGGAYTDKIAKCNCYVRSDEPTPQDVMREKRVDELNQQNLCQVYTLQSLLEELK